MRDRWPRARHALVAAATERLGYKALALFFAVALWVAARSEMRAERLVPVRLLVQTDAGETVPASLPPLRAVVVGRQRELLALAATPPEVRRVVAAGATPESLRLELRPADVDLPPGVDASVRDVRPRVVTVRLGAAAGTARAARAARP